jgi:NAD(P)-dependent dehydrogenase (short-subunit alcohol dehydrogenase family)
LDVGRDDKVSPGGEAMISNTLRDKVVLITGATGALGSTVVGEFAQTEAQLALTSTSPQKLEQLAAEIGLPEERVFSVVADVTQADRVEVLMAAVVAHFGRVDVLLNTVGGWSDGHHTGNVPFMDRRKLPPAFGKEVVICFSNGSSPKV